jgi:hypothetical protein
MSCKGPASWPARRPVLPHPKTRWTLSEIQKDSLQRGLPTPDEASVRHYCLLEGVDAPDLVMVKDFLLSYIATSCGKIIKKPMADSVDIC